MCLNSGENDNGQFYFQNYFRREGNDKGGKMTESITVFNHLKTNICAK